MTGALGQDGTQVHANTATLLGGKAYFLQNGASSVLRGTGGGTQDIEKPYKRINTKSKNLFAEIMKPSSVMKVIPQPGSVARKT